MTFLFAQTNSEWAKYALDVIIVRALNLPTVFPY